MIDFTFLGLVRRSKRQFVSCSVDDSYLQKWDNSFPWGFETQAPFDTCWMCLDAVGRDFFILFLGGVWWTRKKLIQTMKGGFKLL